MKHVFPYQYTLHDEIKKILFGHGHCHYCAMLNQYWSSDLVLSCVLAKKAHQVCLGKDTGNGITLKTFFRGDNIIMLSGWMKSWYPCGKGYPSGCWYMPYRVVNIAYRSWSSCMGTWILNIWQNSSVSDAAYEYWLIFAWMILWGVVRGYWGDLFPYK